MKTYEDSYSLTISPLPSNRSNPSQAIARKEIIFIDQGVDDYPMLIAGTRPGIEIYTIDTTQDGVLQITDILQQQRDINAVHIVSHGNVGYLALGNSVLSTYTLNDYQDALFSWQRALRNNADILIYGCNVGKDPDGQYFIQQLAHITGANIAASSNLTGNSELGGDWGLDILTNAIASTHAFYDENLKHYASTLVSNTLDFSNDTVTDYVTATHPTASFGTINFKIVKDINSTGTANASLTLALTGGVDHSYDDFYYTGTDGVYLVIYTDGREVDFQSVNFGSIGATIYTGLTVYAYQDGSLLGSQTFSPAGTNFPNDPSSITPEMVTFTSSIFNYADEIRLIGANNFGDDVGQSLIDDLVIADPVPPNATPSLAVSDTDLTYTENAAATQIDSAATLSDADGDADWNGGKLEVQITANNEAADRITISDTDGDGTAITVSGTDIFANGTDIGDLSASGGSVTNGAKLTITFDADATNTHVQEVLQSIHYDNTSDNPGTTNRTITFTATDKNSAAASDTRTVAMTAVNDAPTMTATPATPTFTEDGSAASLFSGTAISAVESGDSIISLALTVTNVNDGSDEILSIDGSNVSLTDGNSIATATNAMTADVSITGSTATVTITKAGGITPAAAQTLVNAITYSNTSQNPSTQNRVITLTSIKDSGGTANGGTDTTSLAIASTVTVTSVNDAPTLTATGNSPTFTQGGAAVDLFNGVTASTIESGQTLQQLIITVTNVMDGAGANEYLTVDGQNIALSNANSGSTLANSIGYSVGLVAGTATLTLTKSGMSSADVQSLVDGLAYNNTSTPPSSANRVITITSLQDSGGTANGGLDSATLSLASTVTVVPNPLISSATYDAATGTLVVTGANIQANGSGADIDVSNLTFTGEGGATYTLTNSSDVERDTSTQFTVTLSATDKAALNQIINKNGLASTGGTAYNLAAADDWNTNVTIGDTSDNTNDITASNVAVPTITLSTYDAGSGMLVVTGTGFLQASGAANDIDVSRFKITGEGGATYTLTDTTDVEITSGTSFTVTLSSSDKSAINQIVNKNGTSSTSGTTYNLAAAEDWATGADAAVSVADLTGNGVTVSNVAAPTINASTYDASAGVLVVTGTGFLSLSGAANDIDVSKLTITGEGSAIYMLTDSADVEITSDTTFTVILSATDQAAINQIINKNGVSSTDGTTYNLAAAEDWAAGADAAVVIADLTGNGITVSNVAAPSITSSTYDANTGVLVVTGTNIQSNSSGADIDVSQLTLTGEEGTAYTLTDSADVERDASTQFTVILSATDKAAVNQIFNKNGTASTGGTAYNLAAADDWNTNVTDGDIADTTGNDVTVSSVAIPTLTSATYDASTGKLVVTGSDYLKFSGVANDIDVSALTFTGEGGDTYTLNDSSDVEITSDTSFTVILSAADKAAITQIINKNGTSSTGGTAYNLAAAEDWVSGADPAVTVADLTGNGITVSNVAAPAITTSTYDASTGSLVVTGTSFLGLSGTANDIDVSKLTFTGEGGATYTLTDTADVEITSDTSFNVTLSTTDKAAVNQIINKNGTSSKGGTTYNLAAAEDWAAGADPVVAVADLTSNGITATVPGSSSGGGGGNSSPDGSGIPPTTPTSTQTKTSTIDGVKVTKTTKPDGSVLFTTPIVEITRQDDPASLFDLHADFPIVTNSRGNSTLTVSIPAGVGLSSEGQPKLLTKQKGINDLIQRIEQKTAVDSEQRQKMTNHSNHFFDSLKSDELVSVHTIELVSHDDQKPKEPIIINGSKELTDGKQLLIIDASNLPAGTALQLNNIEFAVIIGAVRIGGGKGKNFVTSDHHDQLVILGADDDILFSGDGNDTVGSLGGDDQISGDAGNDIVFGGAANDTLIGGTGNDQLNGGLGFDNAFQEGQLADYQIEINGHELILRQNNGEVDTLTDIELIRFSSSSTLAIAHSTTEAAAHHLVKTWLERDLTVAEGNAVQSWHSADIDDILAAFLNLPEATDLRDKTSSELLAGMGNNPNILRLDVSREYIGTTENDQGYLPLGLALIADGGIGHDVLHMHGTRNDVHLEFAGDVLELTRLKDGAMLGLTNAEAIAFDSGETVVLAHNSTEGILARLFHSFFNRDATSVEWQLGREALAAQVNPDIILDWFMEKADLDGLSNSDYIQIIYQQTLDRLATESELNEHLYRIDNGQVDREWLAVEIASSAEAINLIGNVIVHEGWI